MNVINIPRERQYFLWSVLGPLMALVTLLLMANHPTALTTYIQITLAFGIPACWYFKRWGVIASAFVLVLILFFKGDAIPGETLWHIGLAASVVLTLYLCSNGLEEANELVEGSSGNSKTYQHTLEQVKSDFENAKYKLQNEQQLAKVQIEKLSQELKTSVDNLSAVYQENEQVKNELTAAKNEVELARQTTDQLRNELENKNGQDEHLLDELLEKRSEVIFLRDQLLEMQHELNQRPEAIVEVQNDEELDLLKETLLKKEQDLFNLQFRVDSALEDIQTAENALTKHQNEEILQKQINHELSQHIDTLQREKELLETSLNSLQQESEQFILDEQEKNHLQASHDALKQQVVEYQQQLDQLADAKQERDSLQVLNAKLQQQVSQFQQQLDQLVQAKQERDSLQASHANLQQQIQPLLLAKQQRDALQNVQASLQEQIEKLQLEKQSYEQQQSIQADLQQQIEKLLIEKQAAEEQAHERHQTVLVSLQQQLEDVKETHKKELLDKSYQLNLMQDGLIEKSRQFNEMQSTLKSELTEKIEQLKVLEEKQSQPQVVDTNFKEENGLRRRAEGLYAQLRQQFEEKSVTLDDTRRQLFHAEEKLLQLQNESKEHEEFQPNAEIQQLMAHIRQMEHQIMELEQENAHLNDIVGNLV